MTATTPTSRFSGKHSIPRRGSAIGLLALIVIAIAASSTFLVISTRSAAMQGQDGTAVATPSQEDLQDVRDQAIEDEVDQLELEFDELNDSGVEGTVTLYDLDAFTLLAILIEDGGEVHPGHIHEGTCDDLDPQPFAPLNNVTNEEVSLSLVDTPLAELLEDDYSVDLHLSPNELGTLIVCADIEGTPTPATPVPAATPGTPDAVGGLTATETPEPTEPPATNTPTPAPTMTPGPTETPTPSPTPAPTEPPPSVAVEETPAPTETPVTSLENVSEDGTGGSGATSDDFNTPESGKGNVIASGVDSADGTSGVGGDTTVVSGKGDAITSGVESADGTSGVGGDRDDRTTTTLTQNTGVGSTFAWSQSPTGAISWALGVFALVLGGFAVIIRRADRADGQPPRWNRLGI
ncbi:MAG: hypothetical protein M3412_08260 [Chloroflexota bacterium]|nr:hypothetical protein [Chloroflexota bacterium]